VRTLYFVAALLVAGPAMAEPARAAAPAASAAPAAGAAPAAPAAPAATPAPADSGKALYALGLSLAQNLEPFALTPAELETVLRAVREGLAGKPAFALDTEAQRSVQQLVQARLAVIAEREKGRGEAFLKTAAAAPGAVATPSGLIYTSLKEGTGETPAATDKVKVHYAGTLTDGKEFDSSIRRGQPAEFPLNQVIPCWTEGVGKMKVGGKAKLVCPSAIAYGPSGRPPVIPGNAVLVFEVELLAIVK
jgi:FKBP-type peptidyl-prolyl cis-trans isomerase